MNVQEHITGAAPAFDMRQSASKSLSGVFDTMLNFKVQPCTGPFEAQRMHGERVSSSVALVGDNFVGGIFIHMREPLARDAAAAVLGLESTAGCADQEVNDVICELANMVAGGVKSELCNRGYICAMSIPSIVRGAAFEIEVPPGATHERYIFSCRSDSVVLEAHFKFN